jgi:alpha-beta hydrolase superfamily lysophospholipase
MKLIVPQSTLILKHKIFSKGNIIFIHGFGSCSFNAIKLLTNLFQKGFNVYAFDLPNHGKNSDYATQLTVDEYISFSIQKIKSFNLKKFFLMGHSMGGGIVSYIGSEFPTQIKGMILLSPFNYGAAIHTKRKIASFGIKLLGPFSTLLSP